MNIRNELIEVWGEYKVNSMFRETSFSSMYSTNIDRSNFGVQVCNIHDETDAVKCADTLLHAVNLAYWPLFKWSNKELSKLQLYGLANLLSTIRKHASGQESDSLKKVSATLHTEFLGKLDLLENEHIITPNDRFTVAAQLIG